MAKLQETPPPSRQREADSQALSPQGFLAGHVGQDRTRERLEIERDLAGRQAKLKEAEAALAESRQSRLACLVETPRQLSDRLAKASLVQSQPQQHGAKTAQREQGNRSAVP